MLTASKKARGIQGEAVVARWLEDQGFTILTTNYRQRFGEIDIIAESSTHLLFVEVKWRAHPAMLASELVPVSKQKKIVHVARSFLATHPYQEKIIRFDVAIVYGDQYDINYIAHAFIPD